MMGDVTVSKAYLREMKAKQARRKRMQEWEALGRTDMLRLEQIDEKYADPERPLRLFDAQMTEIMRNYAIKAGVCDDCLAKFPDPLA